MADSDGSQTLRYEGPPHIVSLDPGTYMWVHLAKFRINPAADDAHLIAALTSHRAYRISFWDDEELGPESVFKNAVHGPYRLSRINAGLFQPVDAESAAGALFAWANDQDWDPPYTGQSADTSEQLQIEVCTLFRRGTVYRLSGLTENDYEESTPVGSMGFVEFIVIDRHAAELHLIVASDD